MSILMFDDPVQYTQRFNSQWPRIFQKSYGKDSILLRLFTKKNCNKQNPYRNKHRGDKDENWKSVKLEIMLNFISQLNLAIRLITCYLFIYLFTYIFISFYFCDNLRFDRESYERRYITVLGNLKILSYKFINQSNRWTPLLL